MYTEEYFGNPASAQDKRNCKNPFQTGVCQTRVLCEPQQPPRLRTTTSPCRMVSRNDAGIGIQRRCFGKCRVSKVHFMLQKGVNIQDLGISIPSLILLCQSLFELFAQKRTQTKTRASLYQWLFHHPGMMSSLPAFIGNNSISPRILVISRSIDEVTICIYLQAPEDILGPGYPAVIRGIPLIRNVDMSTTASSTCTTLTISATSTISTSTTVSCPSPSLSLLWKERSAGSKGRPST